MTKSLPKNQQGIVLIVAMVMLVVISILGISSTRGVAMGAKTAANTHDRSIAFQAAEAALRAGEQAVLTGVENNIYNVEQLFDDPNFVPTKSGKISIDPATIDLGELSGTPPAYEIEYLGNGFLCDVRPQPDGNVQTCSGPAAAADPLRCACMRFRVTATSNPGDERANVTLQSIFYSR
jgi:type IV pilus assembly protein PilX